MYVCICVCMNDDGRVVYEMRRRAHGYGGGVVCAQIVELSWVGFLTMYEFLCIWASGGREVQELGLFSRIDHTLISF